jgi:hypothetical protein
MVPRDVPVSLEPDPVIDAYKRDIDMTQVRERLKLTPDERVRLLQRFVNDLEAVRPRPRERA